MDFIPTTIRGLFDTSIQFVVPVYQSDNQSIKSVKDQIKESKEEFDKLNLREEDILRMMFDKKNKKGN